MKHPIPRGPLSNPLLRSVLLWAAIACVGTTSTAHAKTAADAARPNVTLDACSWERPGHNPFMGDVVAAVDRYRDIAPEVRERLKARMLKREYDDLVSIRRDSITGRAKYGATIRDMHFGTHQVCRSVTRTTWSAGMQERGLVYCESGQCILVPTVCRNVSRIARSAVSSDRAEAPEVAPAEAAAAPGADPAATPLAFDHAPRFDSAADGFGPAVFGGGSGGNGYGAGPAAGSFGSGAGSPTVSTTSVPPFGSDSQALPLAAAVPEPQTWALMLGGLAALALARRRRIKAP